MGRYGMKAHEFLYGKSKLTTVKPLEPATKEDIKKLEKKWEELRDFARDTRIYSGQQFERIEAIERELGMDHWGNANQLHQLKCYMEHLIDDKTARKGTHKRRRVTVKSGGETVEITRND